MSSQVKNPTSPLWRSISRTIKIASGHLDWLFLAKGLDILTGGLKTALYHVSHCLWETCNICWPHFAGQLTSFTVSSFGTRRSLLSGHGGMPVKQTIPWLLAYTRSVYRHNVNISVACAIFRLFSFPNYLDVSCYNDCISGLAANLNITSCLVL